MGTRDTRDILGGFLLMITGVFFALHSGNYTMGEAARMGPGYFPTVLGWILAFMGLLITLMALRRPGEAIDFQWKNLFYVLFSVVFFAFTLPVLGLVLAVAGTVFIGSMADNDLSWRARWVLTVVVPIITVLVFVTGLSMNMPLTWMQ